jgi:hypothetical protein
MYSHEDIEKWRDLEDEERKKIRREEEMYDKEPPPIYTPTPHTERKTSKTDVFMSIFTYVDQQTKDARLAVRTANKLIKEIEELTKNE